MEFSYLLTKIAQNDYEVSLEWYLERSSQAAEKFMLAVDDTLELICNNPYRWRNQYKNFYQLTLKKYPFTIIYIIEEAVIIVTAIYHQKRNPKKRYRK
jgi:plasmid stabilization system protein ParE